jgi:hypothetical protein
MSDDKRTYQADVHLGQNLSLQPRRAKGKPKTQDLVSMLEASGPSEQNEIPISQDLILRLIKLLKES